MDTNTYTFSKLELATYLRDYYKLMLTAQMNQRVPFYYIFCENMKNSNRPQYAMEDYYLEMIRIFEFFLISKIYSVQYDSFMDSLLDADIEALNIPNSIFVNPLDASKFSNKQKITFIRNALNHNDNDEHEKYKIKRVDGEIKIEIHLLDVRSEKERKRADSIPRPFHIEFSIKEYIHIMHELFNSKKLIVTTIKSKSPIDINSFNCMKELDKVFIRKYYSIGKPSKDELDNLRRDIASKEKKVDEILGNEGFYYIDFPITLSQKVKIEEDLRYWESRGENGNIVIDHLIMKTNPLPEFKVKNMMINFHIAEYYVLSEWNSLFSLIDEARKIYTNQSVDKDSPLYHFVNQYGINIDLLYTVFDLDDIIALSSSIFYGYLFDTLVTDEDILIGRNKYKREKVRDSFVHVRWFKGINECYKLYDWGNGKYDEFNPEKDGFWRGNIPLVNMAVSAEYYYNEAMKKLNGKSILDFPIHFRRNRKDNDKIAGISFIKNNRLYYYCLNVDSYEKKYIPWGLYIIDENGTRFVESNDDIATFFDELKYLPDDEKDQFKDIIEILPIHFSKCQQFIKGELLVEELRANDDIIQKINIKMRK